MPENNNYNNNNTPYSNGLLGGLLLTTGILIGSATTLLIKENRPQKAGIVLNKAKQQFASKGAVVGSWIDYDSIEYDLFENKPLVYLGGVTVETSDGQTNYQFASDIYTGELIDYFKVSSHKD
ncbi:hypothetical protein ACF3NG_03510 [Aerococcaceae bacterium WGS1372]